MSAPSRTVSVYPPEGVAPPSQRERRAAAASTLVEGTEVFSADTHISSFRHTHTSDRAHNARYYWENHMCASFMLDPLGLELIDRIGVNRAMWSSDYPHNESTFGYSEKSLADVVDSVGSEAAARIAGDSVKKFLGV